MIASASEDRTARVWDAATGRLIREIPHRHALHSIAISPDGKWLATGSNDHEAQVFDLATGRKVHEIESRVSTGVDVAFTADGRRLLARWSDRELDGIDLATGRKLVSRSEKQPIIRGPLAYAPDGRTIAAAWEGTSDRRGGGGIHIHILELGFEPFRERLVRAFAMESWACAALAFSPDGRTIAAAHDGEGEIRLLDLKGRVLRSLGNLRAEVESLAFSPDGTMIAATERHHWPVHLIDVATGKTLHSLETANSATPAFSPDGRVLAVADGVRIRLFDTASGSEIRKAGEDEPIDEVTAVAFTPSGKSLVAASLDGSARLYSAVTVSCTARFELDREAGFTCAALAPNGSALAAGTKDGIRVLDPASRKERSSFQNGEVHAVFFMADSRTILFARDRQVWLWDSVPKFGGYRTFAELKDKIACVALSADRKTLAVCDEREVRVVDLDSRKETFSIIRRGDQPTAVALSPDGKTLAVATGQRSREGIYQGDDWAGCAVRLFDVAKGSETRAFSVSAARVTALAFSPDGARIAAGDEIGAIDVREAASGKTLFELPGHFGRVASLAFSPDGNMLASGSADCTVAIWDVSGKR